MTASLEKKRGSLVVVGTGIQVGQMTTDAQAWIRRAYKVLYCVADLATERLIHRLNSAAESLYVFYADDKRRSTTYEEMVQRTLSCVRDGLEVCAVYYGHPGIFVYPSHQSIKRARAEGYAAVMLPAVSSLDCLFADLAIDPVAGCQIFEATDLLLRDRVVDPTMLAIVWQIGCVGDMGFNFKGFDGRNIPTLAEALGNIYGQDYEVIVYEAAQYSVCDPTIRRIRIRDLPSGCVTGISTLVIPPQRARAVVPEMLERLGLGEVLERIRHSKTAQRQQQF